MHELSICQSLLREVERAAVANGAAAVTGIVVSVGPLSGVEATLLVRAFAIARLGTLAERATLDVENTPIIVRCRSCGAETAVPANALTCGSCGGWQVEVTSGDELLLKRVELAVDEAPMAAAG